MHSVMDVFIIITCNNDDYGSGIGGVTLTFYESSFGTMYLLVYYPHHSLLCLLIKCITYHCPCPSASNHIIYRKRYNHIIS